MTVSAPKVDVLVIGGGQAGLAMGFHLKKTPLCLRIAERHQRVGDSWRNRYASLVLFTPRSYSALPGSTTRSLLAPPEYPSPPRPPLRVRWFFGTTLTPGARLGRF